MNKKERGRPPWVPTTKDLENAEHYASIGMTKEQISDCLGISYSCLNEKSKEFADFNEALKRGKAKGIALVANKLIDNIAIGNVTAQIFYLKCQGKWNDGNSEKDLNDEKIKQGIDDIRERLHQCLK